MQFHHSTHWETLGALLNGKLLAPIGLSSEDMRNPTFNKLEDLGLRCTWFTSQVWSGSRFGPYVLRYDISDLALPLLVPLGQHHGARCFLSAPALLAEAVASYLKVSTCTPSDQVFKRVARNDRIDLLVPWNVPLSDDIYVVQGDTGRRREDDANFASGRLLALMLLRNEHRFDQSLTLPFGETAAASNLLGQLTGQFNTFDRTSARAPEPMLSPIKLLAEALEHLTLNDAAAAKCTARSIGQSQDVATTLATLCSDHFGTLISGEAIAASA